MKFLCTLGPGPERGQWREAQAGEVCVQPRVGLSEGQWREAQAGEVCVQPRVGLSEGQWREAQAGEVCVQPRVGPSVGPRVRRSRSRWATWAGPSVGAAG